ncbi:hypothetical protein EA748_06440, partial [Acinetobacter ursingii]
MKGFFIFSDEKACFFSRRKGAEAMQVIYGERVEAIMLTESWYREHTPHFKASLEDGDIENMP